jgi:hypothetical protein
VPLITDKDKRQETRDKRQETRSKRQEARSKKQEARSKKQNNLHRTGKVKDIISLICEVHETIFLDKNLAKDN